MLRVVENKCKTDTLQQATVVIAGDAPTELTSPEARNQVLLYARKQGFPAHGLDLMPQPYPVDASGHTDNGLLLGQIPIDHWEAEYRVNAAGGRA
jgi:hypothetical protein